MIYENFRVTGAHEAVLDYSDLFSICTVTIIKILMPDSIKLYYLRKNCPKTVAMGMGFSRHAVNRRKRARKGPEPACVLSPFWVGWHAQRWKAN